jgi:hypothetical protein
MTYFYIKHMQVSIDGHHGLSCKALSRRRLPTLLLLYNTRGSGLLGPFLLSCLDPSRSTKQDGVSTAV